MDSIVVSSYAFFAGLTASVTLLSFLGYLHYRDPSLFHFGGYSFFSSIMALLPALGLSLPLGMDLILQFGFLFFHMALARILLNIPHYSPGLYRSFRVIRFFILSITIVSALLVFSSGNSAVLLLSRAAGTFSLVTVQVLLALAVFFCARNGHGGTLYMGFTSGGWFLGTVLILILRGGGRPEIFFLSTSDSDYRYIILMETLLLGIAIIFRMSQQYLANQKVMADLIFAEATQVDYRSLLIELRENFKSATIRNIETPAKQLSEGLTALHTDFSRGAQERLLGELKTLAQNLYSNTQILIRENFQAAPAMPPNTARKTEHVHTIATGKIALWSGTEMLAIGYGNILQNAGFQTMTAKTTQYLTSIVETVPDLNLVVVACGSDDDLNAALAFCKEIRRIRLRTELPIIAVIPTLNMPHQITNFFEAGASDVFSKFLSDEEIIARVKVNVEYSAMAMELKAWHTDLEYRVRHDTEQLRLQGRMNPHFLFNSLNTIYSLLNTDTDSAQRAVILLSDICRFYLEFSYESLVPLALEWEFTRNYLELTRIRYGNFLQIEMNDPTQEGCDIRIPPLSLQPLVENGIKHGLTENEKLARLSLSGRIVGDGAEIVIEDNGAGIHKIDNSRSLGNIKRRLLFYFHHVELQLKNRPGGGAVCVLKFSGRRPDLS